MRGDGLPACLCRGAKAIYLPKSARRGRLMPPDLSEVVVRYPACALRLGGGGSISVRREELHDLGEVQCEGVEGVLLVSGVQGAL